jgi:biopolymer transport protein ExbB
MSGLGSAGPILTLLGLLSVVSVAIFFSRYLALGAAMRGIQERDAWLDALERDELPASPESSTPVGRILTRAAELLPRNPAADRLETDLEQVGHEEMNGMGRGLRTLELIGMIAPLLGLLGTVLGMIQSFRSLELAEGAANASILAGGIWQALLTTAAGLVVAIPALVGAAILQARIERGALEMERTISRIVLARSLDQ